MRNVLLVIIFIMTTSVACSYESVRPKGKILTEIRTINDFDRISVSSGIELEIIQGSAELKIETYENILKYVETFVNNGELTIKLENRVHVKGNAKIKAYVSAELITSISASGGSEVNINQGLKSATMSLNGSGGSTFEGALNCGQVNFDFSGGTESELVIICDNLTGKTSGGGEVTLQGGAVSTKVDLSGGSKLKAYDFVTDTFSGDLSGGSYVRITVNNSLSGDLSGGSKIYYKGDPANKNVSTSGGSEVIQSK